MTRARLTRIRVDELDDDLAGALAAIGTAAVTAQANDPDQARRRRQ